VSVAEKTVVVGSGKGGVGKSTVALNLALALAQAGSRVGLLDADFYGPNIPLMIGLTRYKWTAEWTVARNVTGKDRRLVSPVEKFGLRVMSAGFILAEDQPLLLEGLSVQMLTRQVIDGTDWGVLDYLMVDLPPGNSDIHQKILQLLPGARAVVVVTPQRVAHLDAQKALSMFREAGVEVIGAVENMSAMTCPHCHHEIGVFSDVADPWSVLHHGCIMLGRIPMDPAISALGDAGDPLMVALPESPQANAFRMIAAALG
jgi:ATP-binding protein involved in chromosome partitioning